MCALAELAPFVSAAQSEFTQLDAVLVGVVVVALLFFLARQSGQPLIRRQKYDLVPQPLPVVSAHDVDRVVKRDFADDETAAVFEILHEYKGGSEVNRVWLAVLKLSDGSIDRPRQMDIANCDYRDLLGSAEYPAYFAMPETDIPPEEQQRVIDADWKQYHDWLTR